MSDTQIPNPPTDLYRTINDSITYSSDHAILREEKTWRSYGPDGSGPPVDMLVKDIPDETLTNLFHGLENSLSVFNPIARILEREVIWRIHHGWHSIS